MRIDSGRFEYVKADFPQLIRCNLIDAPMIIGHKPDKVEVKIQVRNTSGTETLADINKVLETPAFTKTLYKLGRDMRARARYLRQAIGADVTYYGTEFVVTYQAKQSFEMFISILVAKEDEPFDKEWRYPLDIHVFVKDGKVMYAHASSAGKKHHYNTEALYQWNYHPEFYKDHIYPL